MITIDCGDLITPDDQLKRRRGKPRHLYSYLNVEARLRSIARRILEGRQASAYAALKDNRSGRYLEKRWRVLKPTLMEGADLTLELERCEGIRIESFDPDRHKYKAIGYLAWVNTGHPFYAAACKAGWSVCRGIGHGEVLIRRHMMDLEDGPNFNMETVQAHLAQLAAIGLFAGDGNQ